MSGLLLLVSAFLQEPGGLWCLSSEHYGSLADGRLGRSVALLGDLNQDACAEYLLGAPEQENFGSILAGSIYLVDGRTGQALIEIKNDEVGGLLGWGLCRVGDVNNDLIPEFAATESGDGDETFLYDGASGIPLWTITEPAGSAAYGNAMDAVGDWNSDGTPDIAVADYFATVGSFWAAGSVHVFSGADGSLVQRIDGWSGSQHFGSNLRGGGDFNGDGMLDLLVQSSWGWGNSVHVIAGGTGLEILRIGNPTGFGYLGSGMDIVPDQDGDGCDEILLGAPPAGSGFGEAYLFSGRTGAILYHWSGEQPYESDYGDTVVCAGDLDGDGVADYVVGDREMGSHPFYTAEGRLYFYSGADGRQLHTITGDQFYSGFGWTLAGGMDITGDGRPDVLATDFVYDVSGISNAGAAFVYSYDPFIAAPLREFSAGTGGTLSFALDFPDTEAGFEYRILASTNRTDQDWLTVRGVAIPLVETSLVYRTWNHPLAGMQGVLDVHGNALVSLQVPAGAASAEVGRTFRFAAVSLAAPTQPSLASGAVLVTVLP